MSYRLVTSISWNGLYAWPKTIWMWNDAVGEARSAASRRPSKSAPALGTCIWRIMIPTWLGAVDAVSSLIYVLSGGCRVVATIRLLYGRVKDNQTAS